jgi:hypothetical protein
MPLFFIKYKRLFLIIGFVIVILILGYLLYAVFFKPSAPETAPTGPAATTTPGGLPISPKGPGQIITPTPSAGLPDRGEEGAGRKASEVANGGLTKTTKINDAESLGATLGANNSDVQFYNKSDGKFYRLDKNGAAEALSEKVFHAAENIKWSPTKNEAIIEYPDGSNIIYNFSAKKQITLPKHWKDFDFSPDGNEIVTKSLGLDPNNRWLAVSNEDGSKVKAIEALGENESIVYPSWSPNNQTIAMYTKGIDFDRQEVFFVGLNNENFKSMTVEGRGFQYKWQPNGNQLLYSVYSSKNDLKPMLWLDNARGESIGSGRRSLNIETWADKCSFASDKDLYCAVPEKMEEGAGLFPELAQNTRDQLYKIDMQTGLKKLIAVPDGSYNMSNLIISNGEEYLYFTDETTKKIYKIKLK